jgi:trk system potassium uptake protein
MAKISNKQVVVIGCSRLGATIASKMSSEGIAVTVIDKDEDAFRKLSDDFSGYTFVGDAENIQTLIDARVNQADLMIAVTDKDNVNLMISEICSRIFKVDKVCVAFMILQKNLCVNSIILISLIPPNYRSLSLKRPLGAVYECLSRCCCRWS